MGGCLLLGLAALLALAIPASIAPASLVGAYVVIVVLAAGAAAVTWRRRRSAFPGALLRIVAVALVYGVVVTVIHVAS